MWLRRRYWKKPLRSTRTTGRHSACSPPAISSAPIRFAHESLGHRADFVGGHRVLTAAAGMAGQNEIAGMALRELRRAQPNVTLAWIANELPMQHPADREHYLEGFRRAGLE